MHRNELVIFPQDQIIYEELITKATEEILISRQALPNIDFCKLLVEARNRGVNVQLLLTDPYYFESCTAKEIANHHNIDLDMATYSKVTLPEKIPYINYLNENGFHIDYINHEKIFLNHSKYMIIDKRKIYIGSAPNSHMTRLDTGIITTNPEVARFFMDLYASDAQKNGKTISPCNDVCISPGNMREIIENMLETARYNIYMMFPVVTDDDRLLEILRKKLQDKIKVYILCSPDIFLIPGEQNINQIHNEKLKQYGSFVKEIYEPIIHNRCIITDLNDLGDSQSKLYIGSGNLKTSSFDKSRETGILIHDQNLIKKMHQVFKGIWDTH